MNVAKYYTLQNGVNIPSIGFGTWQAPDGETAYQATLEAIRAGYRHIDTAAGYGNEGSVGKAIKDSGIAREELFVTTKLTNSVRGYEETLTAFEQSRKLLGLDYVDLYLIHWPNPLMFRDSWQEKNAASWKAFETLYENGSLKSIGISNFLPHHIEALSQTANIAPMVNQIRLCPGETQENVTAYCRDKNILLEAYSPLGTGKIFDVSEVQALAAKYNKSIAQICIRWSLEMGYLPLPKSVTASRIQENLNVFDFELTSEDVSLLANLKECCGPTKDPDTTTF